DEQLRLLVELVEVVGRVVGVLDPVEAEPADVFLDRVDVLLLFLQRVGIVEAQVAAAAGLLRDAEVEADRLRVPDVQVAVGLGREAGHDRLVLPGAKVRGDEGPDEVAGELVAQAAGLVARSCSMARRSRRRTTSLPRTASVSKRGGVATRPVAATLTPMNASFALQPAAASNARSAASMLAASHSSSVSTCPSSRSWR